MNVLVVGCNGLLGQNLLRSQPAASSNASSSSGDGCGRFAPGPPPIA